MTDGVIPLLICCIGHQIIRDYSDVVMAVGVPLMLHMCDLVSCSAMRRHACMRLLAVCESDCCVRGSAAVPELNQGFNPASLSPRLSTPTPPTVAWI